MMLRRLLPRQAGNTYDGHKIALWLFGFIVLMRLIMSVNSIVDAESVARTADGIPLDTYPPAAAQTVVSLFALLSVSRLTISALCVVVLVRYRALVPLMFMVLLFDQLSRRAVLQMMPIPRTGTSPGFTITMILLALTIAGLVLSLWTRRREAAARAAT